MKRTTLLALFAALCTIMITAIGGSSTARSQVQVAAAAGPCPACTFTITVSCSTPPFCFPFVVTTNWNGMIINYTVNTCGTTTFMAPPPCPPYPVLNWVSLDGGATIVPVGAPSVAFGAAPCCVRLSATQAPPNGCYSILLLPC